MGVIGINGTGKSTFFERFSPASRLEPDGGTIFCPEPQRPGGGPDPTGADSVLAGGTSKKGSLVCDRGRYFLGGEPRQWSTWSCRSSRQR